MCRTKQKKPDIAVYVPRGRRVADGIQTTECPNPQEEVVTPACKSSSHHSLPSDRQIKMSKHSKKVIRNPTPAANTDGLSLSSDHCVEVPEDWEMEVDKNLIAAEKDKPSSINKGQPASTNKVCNNQTICERQTTIDCQSISISSRQRPQDKKLIHSHEPSNSTAFLADDAQPLPNEIHPMQDLSSGDGPNCGQLLINSIDHRSECLGNISQDEERYRNTCDMDTSEFCHSSVVDSSTCPSGDNLVLATCGEMCGTNGKWQKLDSLEKLPHIGSKLINSFSKVESEIAPSGMAESIFSNEHKHNGDSSSVLSEFSAHVSSETEKLQTAFDEVVVDNDQMIVGDQVDVCASNLVDVGTNDRFDDFAEDRADVNCSVQASIGASERKKVDAGDLTNFSDSANPANICNSDQNSLSAGDKNNLFAVVHAGDKTIASTNGNTSVGNSHEVSVSASSLVDVDSSYTANISVVSDEVTTKSKNDSEDEDSWDKLFDDDGEALDPNLMKQVGRFGHHIENTMYCYMHYYELMSNI